MRTTSYSASGKAAGAERALKECDVRMLPDISGSRRNSFNYSPTLLIVSLDGPVSLVLIKCNLSIFSLL